jgi:hypothetical protein
MFAARRCVNYSSINATLHSLNAASLSRGARKELRPHFICTRSTFTSSSNTKQSTFRFIWNELRQRPLQYFTIPSVAAFVGLTTNWMGVYMLFYPIDYIGTEWYRASPFTPYGAIGWQGVVPCKCEKMAARLVDIVTKKLLTIEEAFGRLDPNQLAQLLLPIIEDELKKEMPQYSGELAIKLIRPVLPYILGKVLANLQKEIDGILDFESVVLEAFVRDKEVLVELFQKVWFSLCTTILTSKLNVALYLGWPS